MKFQSSSLIIREEEYKDVNSNFICNKNKYTVTIKLNSFMTTNDLLTTSIDKFNNLFIEHFMDFQINIKDASFFYLKPSNKFGNPNEDYPSILFF